MRLCLPFLLWAFIVGPGAPLGAEEAVISPGSFIVFAAGEQAKRSLMFFDPAGGLPKVLVDSPGVMDTQPAVGPGGRLAWIRRNGPDWDLVENGKVVASGAMHLSPAYLPDGTLAAAVSGEEDTSIFAFKASGEKVLLAAGGDGGLAVSPAFSPDGSQMAYVSNQSDIAQIYVTDLLNGGRSRILSGGPVRNTDPDWSPRGDYIAFVTAEKDICLIRPDGEGWQQLTRDQGRNRDPVFSPDGKQIAFSSDRDGSWKLYVMNLDGSGQRPLLPSVTLSQSLPVWVSVKPQTP